MRAHWQTLVSDRYRTGFIMTIAACIMWAFSGIGAEYLFTTSNIVPEWLVVLRLFLSAAIMLGICRIKYGKDVYKPLKDIKNYKYLLFYAIFGVAFCQFSYFKVISLSNAGTGTVLEFFSPVFILLWFALSSRTLPSKSAMLACLCAIVGIFFVATGGDFTSLKISERTLLWGLLAAITTAIYTIAPTKLFESFPTDLILAWAFLIGGIVLAPLVQPWQHTPQITGQQWFVAIFVTIIMGTVITSNLFMIGIKSIGATKAGLYATIEPLVASILTVVLFNTSFSLGQALGSMLILLVPFVMELKALPRMIKAYQAKRTSKHKQTAIRKI
ncbi:MAG: DMT family transporter [Coriobacteriia bacterium]|nr:DMT family transporter [Coriobacteriia bacterium]